MSKKVVQQLVEYSHPSWVFKSFRVIRRGEYFYPETERDGRKLFLAFLELKKALNTVVVISLVGIVLTVALKALGVLF